jgi:hypothetical protein
VFSAGPTFTLSATTKLTEIGGFLNNCGSIIGGIPDCPNPQPFSVEVHRIINGELQDPIIGQFQLSNDDQPLLVSYESADPNLTLQPGTYAALFVAQPGDAGLLLGSAFDPFAFTAGWAQLAVIDGANTYLQEGPYAVRITGELVDTTPPDLTVSVTPNELWPPNHQYVTVRATVTATDDTDPNPMIELVSVTSNEPDNGVNDGNTVDDIVIVSDLTFDLRAERSGAGGGRIYTITYTATDASGNSTTAAAAVTVPLAH